MEAVEESVASGGGGGDGGGNKVKADTKSVLAAIHEYYNDERHTRDKDRAYSQGERWTQVWLKDWEDKEKGRVSDATRAVQVGRGKYERHEDGEQHQYLLLKFFDSRECRAERQRAPLPAIWGMALTAKEVNALSEKVVEGGEEAELIHREPPFPDSKWWLEARWWVEDGKVVGVRVAGKMTQDKVPTVKAVKFVTAGGPS